MPRIPFPNVPNAPGVPQVLRLVPVVAALGLVITSAVLLRIRLAASVKRAVAKKTVYPLWGIFLPPDPDQEGGQTLIPVVTPDNIIDFGYQKEWSITSAPTQDGSFVDYNRVAVPFETHLKMTKAGTENDRALFLKQIENLGTTQLYDIITPEKTYINCNFLRFEVSRRGAQGAFWLAEVDLYFREIRVVTSQYLNTVITAPKDDSAANVQNNGTQQMSTITVTAPASVIQ